MRTVDCSCMHACHNIRMFHSTHPSALCLPPPALQATTARVRVINCVTGADETSQASGGVLPPTTDPDNAPYLVRGASANLWIATLRITGNNSPTAANPIPRSGCWRLQIALVSGERLHRRNDGDGGEGECCECSDFHRVTRVVLHPAVASLLRSSCALQVAARLRRPLAALAAVLPSPLSDQCGGWRGCPVGSDRQLRCGRASPTGGTHHRTELCERGKLVHAPLTRKRDHGRDAGATTTPCVVFAGRAAVLACTHQP